MYLFELIELSEQLAKQHWPMTEVLIKNEDDEVFTAHQISQEHQDDGKVAVVIE